jgi:hypothetical protein
MFRLEKPLKVTLNNTITLVFDRGTPYEIIQNRHGVVMSFNGQSRRMVQDNPLRVFNKTRGLVINGNTYVVRDADEYYLILANDIFKITDGIDEPLTQI